MLWVLELSYSLFVVVLDSYSSVKTHRTVHTKNSVYDRMQIFSRLRKQNRNPKNVKTLSILVFRPVENPVKTHLSQSSSQRPESHQRTGNNVHLQPPHRSLNSTASYGRWLPCHLLPSTCSSAMGPAPPAQEEVQPPALESGLALMTHLWLITDMNAQAMSEQVIQLMPKPLRASSLRIESPYWGKPKAHREPQRPALGPADHPRWGPSSHLQRLMCPLDWTTACSDIWLRLFSVFPEEIHVGTGGVSKVDDPSQCGWVLSNPIRTWAE